MEDKIKDYIKDLVLIRKCYIKKSRLYEKEGNSETAMYYGSKAMMLKAVIADLKKIVEGKE